MELNESWLNGQYKIGEISVTHSTVQVSMPDCEDFFAQGEDAKEIIKEIHAYWLRFEVTQEEAFQWWINCYL